MSIQSVDLSPRTGKTQAWVLGLIAALLAAVAFRGALSELVRRWTTQEEYSHGFLIPLVTAWLLWTRRDALLASIGRPAWTGALLILLAMVMHVGRVKRDLHSFPAGFYYCSAGNHISSRRIFLLLRAAFFPVIFLIFAIPLPYFIDANLSLQLQLISSQLGAFFIRLFQSPSISTAT